MQITKKTLLIAILVSFAFGILAEQLIISKLSKLTSEETSVENTASIIEQSIPECFLGRCPTYTSADVDGDKQSESLVIVPTAMTKGAGELWIIDNEKLVFKSETYAQISVNANPNGNGFTINHVSGKAFSEDKKKVYTYKKDGTYVEKEQ
ncbi:MAG: hypothetical protein ACOC5T_10240 [Elusimicrobiota bacterium]